MKIKIKKFKKVRSTNDIALKLIKKNVLIANISRGSLIDNNALIKFLKKNPHSGACLDVFEDEPLKRNSKFLI